MNPHDTYRQQRAFGWTRIDMLLALYDGAMQRIEQAREAMERGDTPAAQPLLLRAQRIVVELHAGLDLRHGQLPHDFQRLYGFVLHALSAGTGRHLAAALDVLRTLRDGLAGIRDETVRLERSGTIPPVDQDRLLQATG
jgi:flagellin-specific chaperone FliS